MNIKFYLTTLILLSPVTQTYSNWFEDRPVWLALGSSAAVVSYLIDNCYENLEDNDNVNLSKIIPSSNNVNQNPTRKYNATINMKDADGFTALHRAIFDKSFVTVKQLLQNGANVEITDNTGISPLLFAAYYGDAEIVQVLLEHGANIEARLKNDQSTALILAADKGYIQVVQALLAFKANVDARNVHWATALIYAVIHGFTEIVEMLVAAGANINVNGVNGVTPLQIAFELENSELIKLLIVHGANVHALMEDGITSLHAAVSSDLIEIVQILLARNVDVNAQMQSDDTTPLHLAVCGSDIKMATEITQELLTHGAYVNARNAYGGTPLHVAAMNPDSDYDIIQTLLEYGADINAQNNDGDTPLHLAILERCEDAMRVLLKNNADFTIKNNAQKTALDYALEQGLTFECRRRDHDFTQKAWCRINIIDKKDFFENYLN